MDVAVASRAERRTLRLAHSLTGVACPTAQAPSAALHVRGACCHALAHHYHKIGSLIKRKPQAALWRTLYPPHRKVGLRPPLNYKSFSHGIARSREALRASDVHPHCTPPCTKCGGASGTDIGQSAPKLTRIPQWVYCDTDKFTYAYHKLARKYSFQGCL